MRHNRLYITLSIRHVQFFPSGIFHCCFQYCYGHTSVIQDNSLTLCQCAMRLLTLKCNEYIGRSELPLQAVDTNWNFDSAEKIGYRFGGFTAWPKMFDNDNLVDPYRHFPHNNKSRALIHHSLEF